MAKWTLILLLVVGFKSYGQEQQNIADLDFLYQAIQKTPSYKDQLKRDDSYKLLYQNLRKDLKTTNDFEVYQKLLQLIYSIKDNHLGFYRTPDSLYKFGFLKPKLDLLKLKSRVANYPIDSLEGVYTDYAGTGNYILYKDEPNIYNVLNINTGIIVTILHRNSIQNFDAIIFNDSPTPAYRLRRNVKFSNGKIISLPYQKTSGKNYSILNAGPDKYEYKEIGENIGYIRLSSFSSIPRNIKTATDFFNEIKPKITIENLIVDVRDNGGGGYKTSRQFIDFLNNFKGRIYILQNEYTVSNAEQFIIDLRNNKNVKTLGATTMGTITYGSNYGKNIVLPSKRFTFYQTDMKGRKRDLAFESIGIAPDIMLNPSSEDWITQTLKLIK